MQRVGAGEGYRLAGLRTEARVPRDADQVVARRDFRLSVAAVEHEVLAAEEEPIGVRVSGANTLVARRGQRPAAPELRVARRLAEVRRVGIGVEHAEASLRGAPDEPGGGIDQLVL